MKSYGHLDRFILRRDVNDPTPPPPPPPAGFHFRLTPEQVAAIAAGNHEIVIPDTALTGAMNTRITSLKTQHTTALAAKDTEIAGLKTKIEEHNRTTLETQQNYQTLYEQERSKTGTLSNANRDLAIRAAFAPAAYGKKIIDIEGALAIAKTVYPDFGTIVQVDAAGNVSGLDAIIDRLVTDRPHLLQPPATTTPPAPTTIGAPTTPTVTPTPAVRPQNLAQAGDMLTQALTGDPEAALTAVKSAPAAPPATATPPTTTPPATPPATPAA